ncbi:MAG: AsnC family transcriptional regulator [Candidatus Latescibacteria bacterium]|nr:AsnC family transcriptional regulator [Candidatus Latescibacterota bacterium]
MDELDLKIALLLSEDGRISYRNVAKKLNIAEPTARYRVKQLLDSGKVRIHASLDLKQFPDLVIAYAGIKQIGNPIECLDLLSKIPEVIYTVNTAGRYDIIALIAATSRERLGNILINNLINSKHHHATTITSTETHIVLFERNMLIPADKIIKSLDS